MQKHHRSLMCINTAFSFFRPLLKCHLNREALPGHPAKVAYPPSFSVPS